MEVISLNNVSLFLAFAAGLLSFLSPCVLPLVPGYICYLTGISIKDTDVDNKTRLNVLYKSVEFVFGFSIIFILMGASITYLGRILIRYQQLFRSLSGILIIIFGLHTLGIFKIKLFYREIRVLNFSKYNNGLSSISMGMAFAAGWTPCVGPILSSILLYASNMNTVSKGIFLLIAYSLGLAVPFLLTALAVDNMSKNMLKAKKLLPYMSTISGIMLIIMGILIFTNKLAILSKYLNFINL
jgi:cytochrome c-type biogenesis protein